MVHVGVVVGITIKSSDHRNCFILGEKAGFAVLLLCVLFFLFFPI